MDQFEIVPLGDSALLVRMRDAAVDSLLAAQEKISSADADGIGEIVLGFASLAIFFDRSVAISDASIASIAKSLRRPNESTTENAPARVTEIPVCYDGDFAADLEDVARHAAFSVAEVIRLHCAAEYCVRCVGFTPGFPYLSGLAAELAMPRRPSPRIEVPGGSVAIGGNQTGIYPTASPGGWNVIGRTPLRLFDPQRESPALFRAGDRVRFRAISRDDFEKLMHERSA